MAEQFLASRSFYESKNAPSENITALCLDIFFFVEKAKCANKARGCPKKK